MLVHLFDTDNVCSSAHGRGKYQQEVKVEAQSSRSVPFVFIFTKEGQHGIEVKASVKDLQLSDGVRKMIRVVVSKHTIQEGNAPFRLGMDSAGQSAVFEAAG